MKLSEIREQFVELSGRRDLEQTKIGGVPSADKFIHWGQTFLDGLIDVKSAHVEVEATVVSGVNFIDVPELRVATEVFVRTAESVWTLLEERRLRVLRQAFGVDPVPSSVQDGPPQLYAQGLSDQTGVTRVFIAPAPDKTYELKIIGLPLTKFSGEDSITWWSVRYPFTLVQAAMYMTERFYRNTEGMQDHLSAIMMDIQSITFDDASKDSANIDSMRDSW